ncbi:MAG: hypothetical protein ABEL97_02760, partial [Salinibacter sp.]
TLPKQVEAYVSPASKMSFEGSGSYVTSDGSEQSWLGNYNYKIASKAEVDKWYGSGPVAQTAGKIRSTSTRKGTKNTDSTVPSKVFGGKVLLRPRAGSGRMCLRLGSQVDVKVGSQDLVSLNHPVAVTLGVNVPSVEITRGNPPLGCFGLTFQDVPANLNTAGGNEGIAGTFSTFSSMGIEWSGLQATGQPLPRSESK